MSKLLNFPIKKTKEGSIEIFIPIGDKISKKLPVFYNPVMKFNRDITISLLKQFPPMSLCDLLSGSGVRAIRFAKELKYKSIMANDLNQRAVALIKKNMKHNKVKFDVLNKDANLLLLESNGFDFIDLDVFGSPNFLLNNSIARLSRDGILAVTATDTGCLAGSFPKACIRKYWSKPLKDSNMHETGLRILIRKVQLIGADHDKALIPIYSYFKDHYFRIFFKCEKGKQKVDLVLKKHGMFKEAGPLWLGELWDSKLAKKISDFLDDKTTKIIANESKINTVGFYDIPNLCKKNKLKMIKQDELIKKIKKKGKKVSLTHFRANSIRSDISEKDLVGLMK